MGPDIKSKNAAINAVYECKFRGIKISDLERRVGISRGYLSRCRKGTRRMSNEVLKKLAKVLGMSFDDLVRVPVYLYALY